MGEPSLIVDLSKGRLLTIAPGTGAAAPFGTHVCARVEYALRRPGRRKDRAPSANRIRALTVHGAAVPKAAAGWVDPTGKNPGRRLRLLGYGMANPRRSLRSTDERVVLLAGDEHEGEHDHVYELDVPAAFAGLRSRRHVRVTPASDPPVRGTRKESLVRKLYSRLVKNHTVEEIEQHARRGKDCRHPAGVVRMGRRRRLVRPVARRGAVGAAAGERGPTPSTLRLGRVLEHSDPGVGLYNRVRTRVATRVRKAWGG
jgi:hypothetical protein